jgi:hypothetical protein
MAASIFIFLELLFWACFGVSFLRKNLLEASARILGLKAEQCWHFAEAPPLDFMKNERTERYTERSWEVNFTSGLLATEARTESM